jgi:hypothetical protein
MRRDDCHQSGLHFRNGYASNTLARMLDTIMQHQEIFLVGAAPGKDRMIQVYPPTAVDRAMASRMMDVFKERMAV